MVAEKAGVSRATVSHVLNGRYDRVSKATKERVLAVMEELGYAPNLLARSMKTKKSQTVGVVIEGIAEGWFTQILLGIEEKLRENNYRILLSSIYPKCEEKDDIVEAINLLLLWRVEGIIIITGADDREPSSLGRAVKAKVPLVLVNFHSKEKVLFPRVMLGYREAGRLAVEHLAASGKKRIAFIGYNIFQPKMGFPGIIFEGFKEGLKKCDLQFFYELVAGTSLSVGQHPKERLEFSKGEKRFSLGKEMMLKLLKNPVLPDAVYCINDHIAFGAMEALIENGVRIPQEVAVVGTNNLSGSNFVRPSLTSIDMQLGRCGELAANTLMASLRGESVEPVIYSPIKLLIRNSSRA